MKPGAHKNKDMEKQLFYVESNKNKCIFVFIFLLSMACIIQFGWSIYLTVSVSNVNEDLIESEYKTKQLNSSVLDLFKTSQVCCSCRYGVWGYTVER